MYETRVIPHSDGFMAMKLSGILFWKKWKPISWQVYPTRKEAEAEAKSWNFYVSCKGKGYAY